MSSSSLHVPQPLENPQPLESQEFKKLQTYKEDLVSQVSSAKLVPLSEELYKAVVISKEVKDAFSTLDHDRLDSGLRVRYLLQYVCEGVKHDVTVFERFLSVLAKHGGNADKVCKRLREEVHVSERGAGSQGQASDETGSSKAVVVDDICLIEDDVPLLMETLVEVCNKWEEMSIALGLHRHTISECKGSSNAVSLTNILYRWISSKHQKEITLKKLKLALDSQLVGRSSFALTMEERFREAKSANVVVAEKNVSGSESQASVEAGNTKAVGSAKRPQEFGELFLSEGDVSILLELLVACAYKWNLIGTSLGLPVSIMKKLEAKSLTSESDMLCLRDILLEWLIGKYESSRHATLNNLKLTLGSELVGLRTAAYHLDERFRAAKRQRILSVPIMPVAKRPHYSTLEIVYQPRDTEVSDGKSTLLEVQVCPNELVAYQWMKDGQTLSDSLAYLGACSDVLVIRLARQGTEGDYTCRISKGSEEVISEVVVLTVVFPPEKKHLINSYSKHSEIPKDSWPIVGTSTFTDLALIRKKKRSSSEYNYSVQGEMDKILEHKDKVSYEDIFGKFESGTVVLLEGRPGSGKTTLVHKVTRDWAIRGDVLKNAQLVFHISLRCLANANDEKLSDILELFYQSKEEREKVVSGIERSQGEGVCFIVDGLDEYQPQDKSKSVIYQLFRKRYLSASMIIIVSRPVASASLRRRGIVTKQFEVLGFTEQRIFEYIDKFPFSSDLPNSNTSPSNLKAYLRSHRNVLHMCYLPVHAGMICFLYEHEKGDIPPTETKIYEHFTRFIVLRKLRRGNRKVLLHSLEDIGGEDQDHFRKICHLAFDMTIHSKQVIHQYDTDVPPSHNSGPDDAPSLGLIIIDSIVGLFGHDETYTFLHLTFQEYLTALYISKLGDDEQMEMIRLHAGGKHMMMVWKFYCGMVKFEDKEAQIEQIMVSTDSLHRVQYAFESQQCVVCDSVLEFGRTSVLEFNTCTLTPADLTAVGYVMSTTSHPVTKLSMKWCELHSDHVKAFLKQVSTNKLMCIQTLDLLCNHIGADGAAALADGLQSCSNLQTLNLSDNDIGTKGATALAHGLKFCNNLQTLHLSDNNIDTDGAAALADGLKFCTNLQTLHLSDNNIGADGVAALANLKCRIQYG